MKFGNEGNEDGSVKIPEVMASVPEVVAMWAETRPDVPAFVFLEDGEREVRRLTFSQLHRACNGLASLLRQRIGAGERALLLYPQGLEFAVSFLACLYGGIVAVPVSAPDARAMRRSMARLAHVVADAAPKMILTTRAMRDAALPAVEGIAAFDACEWLPTEDVPWEEEAFLDPLPREAAAYLQYTSGSTSAPKGVEISHANMMHNLVGVNMLAEPREGDCLVSWLPQFHDFGLMFGTVWPVYTGVPTYLMTPADFVAKPSRWLEAITKYKGTHSGGANFAYDLCARKVDAATLARLDLSSWRMTINGAEPVRAASLEAFTKKFAAVGFRKGAMRISYGMAESTLAVTSIMPGDEYRVLRVDRGAFEREHRIVALDEGDTTTPCTEIVGCGTLIPCGHAIAAVSPETFERLADDVIGEVWIGGGSVAMGYHNNDAATQETFRAQITGEEGYWLRSGDLGFMHNGEIYITGRKKDVIIVRGANYYPQDIEETAYTSHEAFRPGCASAFAVPGSDTELLVVVLELTDAAQKALAAEGEALAHTWVRALREKTVREHGIHAAGVVLLPPRTLPKTTSGKIQRGPCREALYAGELSPLYAELPETGAIASAEAAEIVDDTEWLRARLAGLLAVPVARVGAEDSMLDLGLDSLKAMDLIGQVQERFGARLEPADVFDAVTVDGLIAVIGRAEKVDAPAAAEIDFEEGSL